MSANEQIHKAELSRWVARDTEQIYKMKQVGEIIFSE